MRNIPFVNSEYYHILSRGADKRNIFLDQRDYKRFLKGLKVYNSDENLRWISMFKDSEPESSENKKLVDIIYYCLMPNHYHILLKQKQDQGITKFMRRLNTGYAMYFNLKYERTGYLFGSKFKSIHIDDDDHLKHLELYIHLNPLDLFDKEWRSGQINQIKKAMGFVERYPWSSYQTYKDNSSNPDLIKEWISRDNETISHLTLE